MDNIEKRLRTLFDFQRFAGNERLDAIIRAAGESDAGTPLDDGELDLNAAGEPETWRLRGKDGGSL